MAFYHFPLSCIVSYCIVMWCSASGRTYNTVVVSSIHACGTIKMPLAKKAMRNRFIKSSSLEKTQSLVSGSSTLEIEYFMQLSCSLYRGILNFIANWHFAVTAADCL